MESEYPVLAEIYKRGKCKDMPTEIFFPVEEEGDYEEYREKIHFAKITCGECPVKPECQAHGLDNEEFGIWGGLTEKERRSVLRKRSNR